MNIRAPSHIEWKSFRTSAALRSALALTGMTLLLTGCGMRPNQATAALASPSASTTRIAHTPANTVGTRQQTGNAPENVSVPGLLTAARAAYAAKNVVAPAGHNAMEYYEGVLAQDPGNSVARDALREIFPFAIPYVEHAIARNDFPEANREIDVLAKADPTNYSLILLRSRLDAQVSGDAHVLTVTATADSWIQIAAVDGNTVDARMLRAGESRTYHSTGPLRVTLGNADGVAVTSDGQRLELGQHQRNQVVRLLLFAPKALTRASRRTQYLEGIRG
ncbi:MAG TPA: DUF4115 domain-containing protein [Rhodanobacteraceae bacterium]|nr:DUF4115 domain-containing protein [Rhodanobacteraceae bacterium]